MEQKDRFCIAVRLVIRGLVPELYKISPFASFGQQNSLFETLFKKAFCGRSEAFFVVSDFLLAVVVWRSLSVDVFYLLYERLGESPAA